MVSAMDSPVLMLIGINLDSMMPLLMWFMRIRRLERAVRRQPGLLKTHRYTSRRCLLLASWWSNTPAAEAFQRTRAFKTLDNWASERHVVGFWIELYRPEAEGFHRGEGGAPRL